MLSDETIREITTCLDLHAPAARADLAFVFGTRLPEPAHIAADLLRGGAVPAVVLTGGSNRLTGAKEALAHRAILLEAGIAAEQLIVESASTNTLENVTFALPLIAARLDLAALASILVIAKWMHCRRAIMTLKRHFPPGIRYYTCTYHPDGITPHNWFTSDERAAPVLRNWQSIPRYLACGHLAEIAYVDGAYV
ncbi:MAG: YdcF family protein [Anaerolineae bacterium]|nr:YdcF family protein [Anaerolineae bacterium]